MSKSWSDTRFVSSRGVDVSAIAGGNWKVECSGDFITLDIVGTNRSLKKNTS